MVPTTLHGATSLPAVVDIPAGRRDVSSSTQIRTPATRIVDVDVVIPAFNESERLPSTLLRAAEYLGSVPWRSRIIVVDNGSVDDTAGVALRIARSQSVPIEVVGCARPGKGAAVRRGLLSGRAPFVGFFDADLATPLDTLEVALQHLRDGAAGVVASRHLPGSHIVRAQPMTRRLGGAAFRFATHRIVKDVRDTQCGFKFFERTAVTRALVQCRTTGFAFDAELLGRIQSDGGRIVEVPVSWTDDAASTFRPLRDGLACFGAVWQMSHL
jgi:glycosyltransferase involved in cell wall biosynthesis